MYSPYLYSRIKTFVNTYGSGVAKAIAGTGLFFPAVMGQSAFESGYGDKIPKGSNNFGGIKYNPNLEGVIGYVDSATKEGNKKDSKTVGVVGRFSKFKDVESGFKAHIQVLMLPRYNDARFLAKTPEEQIIMIVKAGYSTLPPEVYLSNMKSLIQAVSDYTKIGRIK
jgi:flagellum-specific peptidoglycan hydrolase FlgJ